MDTCDSQPDGVVVVDRSGHTVRDGAAIRAAGLDPASMAPRERAVACHRCRQDTWNLLGWCDDHYRPPVGNAYDGEDPALAAARDLLDAAHDQLIAAIEGIDRQEYLDRQEDLDRLGERSELLKVAVRLGDAQAHLSDVRWAAVQQRTRARHAEMRRGVA